MIGPSIGVWGYRTPLRATPHVKITPYSRATAASVHSHGRVCISKRGREEKRARTAQLRRVERTGILSACARASTLPRQPAASAVAARRLPVSQRRPSFGLAAAPRLFRNNFLRSHAGVSTGSLEIDKNNVVHFDFINRHGRVSQPGRTDKQHARRESAGGCSCLRERAPTA